MLHARFYVRTFTTLALFATAAWGDTIILKSGDKVEGTILSETATEIVAEVKINASIKDERVIKKADIEKIEKIQPDEDSWSAIKGFALGNESLEQGEYAGAVNRLGTFVTQFPQSPHAADAKAMLAKFEEEKKRVDIGEMKLDGKWLTAAQAQEESVQIKGHILLSRMKRHAAAAQYVEAMNAFDVLEKNFGGSASYADAVALARQVAPLLKTAAEQRLVQLKQLVEQNKARLANTQGAERVQLDALQKKQIAATEASVAAIERSGVRWYPLNPANERSIASLLSRIAAEPSRLISQRVEKMHESVQFAEAAKVAIEAGDLLQAETALKDANSAWSNNEIAKRLQPKFTELQKATLEAKAEAEKAAYVASMNTPKATPTPKPTPVPTPAPAVVEEETKTGEPSLLAKPIVWIIIVLLIGFAALAKKSLSRKTTQQEDADIEP